MMLHFNSKQQRGLKSKVDKAMKALKNDGTIAKLQDKWWNTGTKCPNAASGILLSHATLILPCVAVFFMSRL